MDNSDSSYFDGLPASLVSGIAADTSRIAEELFEPISQINSASETMRAQLKERDLLRSDDSTPDGAPPTTIGIDGFDSVENLLTADFACCVTFSAGGETRADNANGPVMPPTHNSLLYKDIPHKESGGILRAVRCSQTIDAAQKAASEIVYVRESFLTAFVTIMDSLRPVTEAKETRTAKEFLKNLQPSIVSLKSILESQNSGKIFAGLPSDRSEKELIQSVGWNHEISDSLLCTLLLSPGEYISPIAVDGAECDRIQRIAIKDENFCGVRDSICESLKAVRCVYYRPHEWTPAMRIEIDSSTAQDDAALAKLLSSIKFQCSTPGIVMPYPLYLVGNMAHNMKKAMPSIRELALTHLTNARKDVLPDIFPLIMMKNQ